MSRNYKFWDQSKLYFTTCTVIRWIDALTKPSYKSIIIDSLNHCIQHKGLEIYAWVIMSNHFHLIIGTNKARLEDIMRDMKRHTSKRIFEAIEENPFESRKDWMLYLFRRAGSYNSNNEIHQFWQQHNHPIELNNNFILEQKLDYIHENPVKAELVNNPEDYIYSSAIDYAGGRGLLPITFI